MGSELAYQIARYDVRAEHEVLIERVQLWWANGELRYCVDDGPEVVCSATDVATAIEADPALSEIRANQVTRITVEPAVLGALPFVLRVSGHCDDSNEGHRVLFVDGALWSAWSTAEGVRMLPDDSPLIRLTEPWGRLSFCESASRTSGLDETIIGLATPAAVASATHMDTGEGDGGVLLWQRGDNAFDDAGMFVEWLLDGGLVPHYSPGDKQLEAMLAQLFVEASINGFNGVAVPGSRLAAAAGTELGFLDLDSSEWTLTLDLTTDVVEAVLDVLAERGPMLRDTVAAARGVASGPGHQGMSHRFAIFPAASVDSVDQANDLICAMGAASEGDPPTAIRGLLAELSETAAGSFAVVRPADSRGVVIATQRPEDGLLGYLLRLTMARGLAVYDVELFRLFDPDSRVEIDVSLSGDVTLPYLTATLLRDLVIRPTWPVRESPYFIVTRTDQMFVQVYRNEDGTYQLEYRHGDAENHFAFQTADIGLVVDVMWAWTIHDSKWRTAVPWIRLEFEAEDPADETHADEPYDGRRVSLQNEHRDDGSWLNLDAVLLPDGTLRIIGHDLGPVTASVSPDSEFEYFYTVAGEDVPALVIALGGQPETDVLDLLERNWSGEDSNNLGPAIRLSGVQHHFSTYP